MSFRLSRLSLIKKRIKDEYDVLQTAKSYPHGWCLAGTLRRRYLAYVLSQ